MMSGGVGLLGVAPCHLLIFPTLSATEYFRTLGSFSILLVGCMNPEPATALE